MKQCIEKMTKPERKGEQLIGLEGHLRSFGEILRAGGGGNN